MGRGGLKLEEALSVFQVPVVGQVCLDVGASTGGFTDCLLQQGAAQVYAVDVGYGQLDWSLREDKRVVVMERTNIREVLPGAFSEVPQLAVIDVSFIGLLKVLEPVAAILESAAPASGTVPVIVALLKPQFEYRDYFPTGPFDGIVKSVEAHRKILSGTLEKAAVLLPDWACRGVIASPVMGGKGNREFLICWEREKPGSENVSWASWVDAAVC